MCVCVRSLLPRALLPQPQLTCPASSFAHTPPSKTGWGGGEKRQEDEAGEGGWADVRAADHASLPGNQEGSGSLLTYGQHTHDKIPKKQNNGRFLKALYSFDIKSQTSVFGYWIT